VDLGIKGKKALICASSQGLGRGCAEALAGAGVDVILNGRTADILENTAAELRSKYAVTVDAVAADVATENGRVALLEAAQGVDILVNNAGSILPRNR
jgi:3-oxoacyl-[acyl-carrier protein] reductase